MQISKLFFFQHTHVRVMWLRKRQFDFFLNLFEKKIQYRNHIGTIKTTSIGANKIIFLPLPSTSSPRGREREGHQASHGVPARLRSPQNRRCSAFLPWFCHHRWFQGNECFVCVCVWKYWFIHRSSDRFKLCLLMGNLDICCTLKIINIIQMYLYYSMYMHLLHAYM